LLTNVHYFFSTLHSMNKNYQSPKRRLFFSIMMATFMWVVLGDLVSMHIELIFGQNINWHHPFAKTQKNDGKTFKVKPEKKADHSGSQFKALASKQKIKVSSTGSHYHLFAFELKLKSQKYCSGSHLRGPPSLI